MNRNLFLNSILVNPIEEVAADVDVYRSPSPQTSFQLSRIIINKEKQIMKSRKNPINSLDSIVSIHSICSLDSLLNDDESNLTSGHNTNSSCSIGTNLCKCSSNPMNSNCSNCAISSVDTSCSTINRMNPIGGNSSPDSINAIGNIRHPLYCLRGPSYIGMSLECNTSPVPDFDTAFTDPDFTINPRLMNLIPSDAWKEEALPFGHMVTGFFRRRNTGHCNFPNKLFNALKMTTEEPALFSLIGVRWITENVMMVEKIIFAKLLGVKTIDGSLFHHQGNFPTHGFIELSMVDAAKLVEELRLKISNLNNVRFLQHSSGKFSRSSNESNIGSLKWMRGT